MPRPIWNGHISFGLVNVPVVLYSGERKSSLGLHMIDSRNSARIKYERVNAETGEEVPWDKIVKGYEYEDGNYVLLSDDEVQTASAEMTKTIEIEQFVDVSEIDIRSFEKPYILVPGKKGEKGYVLLREAIAKAGKAGIAKVVIHNKQYLAALVPQGDALMLELLRFDDELVDVGDFEIPGKDIRQYKVSKQEIDLANKLIDGMTNKWHAEKFRDEYRDVLLKVIEKKVASGQTEVIQSADDEAEARPAQTINFMDVLKRSLKAKPKTTARASKAPAKRSTTRTKRSAKKNVG
jgi:DNA end-binding protein Ku